MELQKIKDYYKLLQLHRKKIKKIEAKPITGGSNITWPPNNNMITGGKYVEEFMLIDGGNGVYYLEDEFPIIGGNDIELISINYNLL